MVWKFPGSQWGTMVWQVVYCLMLYLNTLFWKSVKEFPWNCAFSYSIGCYSATCGYIRVIETGLPSLTIVHVSTKYGVNPSNLEPKWHGPAVRQKDTRTHPLVCRPGSGKKRYPKSTLEMSLLLLCQRDKTSILNLASSNWWISALAFMQIHGYLIR